MKTVKLLVNWKIKNVFLCELSLIDQVNGPAIITLQLNYAMSIFDIAHTLITWRTHSNNYLPLLKQVFKQHSIFSLKFGLS